MLGSTYSFNRLATVLCTVFHKIEILMTCACSFFDKVDILVSDACISFDSVDIFNWLLWHAYSRTRLAYGPLARY